MAVDGLTSETSTHPLGSTSPDYSRYRSTAYSTYKRKFCFFLSPKFKSEPRQFLVEFHGATEERLVDVNSQVNPNYRPGSI